MWPCCKLLISYQTYKQSFCWDCKHCCCSVEHGCINTKTSDKAASFKFGLCLCLSSGWVSFGPCHCGSVPGDFSLKPVVDGYATSVVQLDPNRIQAEVLCVRSPADANEQHVAGQGLVLPASCCLHSETPKIKHLETIDFQKEDFIRTTSIFMTQNQWSSTYDTSILPSGLLVAPRTLVLSLNLRPCFCRIRWKFFEISMSMPIPPTWPKNSTAVTLEPRRCHTDP